MVTSKNLVYSLWTVFFSQGNHQSQSGKTVTIFSCVTYLCNTSSTILRNETVSTKNLPQKYCSGDSYSLLNDERQKMKREKKDCFFVFIFGRSSYVTALDTIPL